MIAEVDVYLAQCQDEYDEFHKTRGKMSNSYDRIVKVNLPMVEKFADYLKVDKTSLYEWAKLYPEFSYALNKINEEQRRRLLENGLSGDYNPMIAKLILSANYGMKEKSDVTTNDKDISTTIVINEKTDAELAKLAGL